jgi:hypothetical protein
VDKKVKRNIIRITSIIFWIVVYFLGRSERFNPDKDPRITYALWMVIGGYIVYESYTQGRNNKTNKKKRKAQLSELLKNRKRYEPKIIERNIPEELHEHIPLVLKWGIDNKILRTELYDNSTDSDLNELKKIESKTDKITIWIKSDSSAEIEKKAFQLTLDAYNELGLWTWNKAHEPNNGEHAGPL